MKRDVEGDEEERRKKGRRRTEKDERENELKIR